MIKPPTHPLPPMASAPEASARVACREGVAAVAAALLAAARAVDRRTVMVFGVCERALSKWLTRLDSLDSDENVLPGKRFRVGGQKGQRVQCNQQAYDGPRTGQKCSRFHSEDGKPPLPSAPCGLSVVVLLPNDACWSRRQENCHNFTTCVGLVVLVGWEDTGLLSILSTGSISAPSSLCLALTAYYTSIYRIQAGA